MFLGRAPGPGEALWTDSDRAWALALLQVEDETCRGCGQPLGESTSPELEEGWTAEVIRCHACTTAAYTTRAFQKDGDSDGVHVHVHRKEGRRG
ncbi:hypothetical protein ACFWOG_04340 [Kitasatospora sp. NPDC058406]|uniref:hypothetical protein n=1 Tax=Kitasatospora sp. NPDC058406 TaxID=3346483 RepID=UPI00364E0127